MNLWIIFEKVSSLIFIKKEKNFNTNLTERKFEKNDVFFETMENLTFSKFFVETFLFHHEFSTILCISIMKNNFSLFFAESPRFTRLRIAYLTVDLFLEVLAADAQNGQRFS